MCSVVSNCAYECVSGKAQYRLSRSQVGKALSIGAGHPEVFSFFLVSLWSSLLEFDVSKIMKTWL